MGNTLMEISVPLDKENFIELECDFCKNRLMLHQDVYERDDNINFFCPICGLPNKINTFLNKKTDFKVYELILFGTLIMIVSVFLTVVVMNDASHNKNALSNSSLAEFEEVYDLINTSYYKKVSKKKIIEGAINGMLDSLDDPHTSYFTKTEKENFDELMNGSYDGIGAEISLDKDGNVIVFSVFKNSPAQEAGLKFNDKIIERRNYYAIYIIENKS